MKNNLFKKQTLLECYWAGFLAADGCVDNKNGVRLCLSESDINHIKKFKELSQYDNKIYKNPKNTNTHFGFINQEIIKTLNEKYNITERKTLTLCPPSLSKGRAISYIIGYIDGDGTIGFNNYKHINGKRYKFLRLRIMGTKQILSWINLHFNKNAIPRIHGNSNIYITSYNDKKLLIKLKNFIIKNNLPVLERKWNKV